MSSSRPKKRREKKSTTTLSSDESLDALLDELKEESSPYLGRSSSSSSSSAGGFVKHDEKSSTRGQKRERASQDSKTSSHTAASSRTTPKEVLVSPFGSSSSVHEAKAFSEPSSSSSSSSSSVYHEKPASSKPTSWTNKQLTMMQKPMTFCTSFVPTPYGKLCYLEEIWKMQLEMAMSAPHEYEFELRLGSWKTPPATKASTTHHVFVSSVSKEQATAWSEMWASQYPIAQSYVLQLFLPSSSSSSIVVSDQKPSLDTIPNGCERVSFVFYPSTTAPGEFVLPLSELQSMHKTPVVDRDWSITLGEKPHTLGIRSSVRKESKTETTTEALKQLCRTSLRDATRPASAPSHLPRKQWKAFQIPELAEMLEQSEETTPLYVRMKTIQEFALLPWLQLHISIVTSGKNVEDACSEQAHVSYEVELEPLLAHPECPRVSSATLVSYLLNYLSAFFKDPHHLSSTLGLWPHPREEN